MEGLRELLDDHSKQPFPTSVVKGLDYGGVDAVMVGSDIFGWASAIARGDALATDERSRLEELRTELAAALPAFPAQARPYYSALIDIADAALRS